MSKVNLSENTIKTYRLSINKLKKLNLDINNVTVETLRLIFEENHIPLNTQNTYLNSLLWYYKIEKIKEDYELIEFYKEVHENQFLINNEYEKNELSIREKENFVSWYTILNVYDKLKKDFYSNNDKRLHLEYLILSFFIYHPPRRSDYVHLYIEDTNLPTDMRRILWTNKSNTDNYGNDYKINDFVSKEEKNNVKQLLGKKNYYMQTNNSAYFIFENYKTQNIYGKQVIEVNDELNEIIKNYIKLNNLKKGDKLINLNENGFLRMLAAIFSRYLNKKISVSMLRHIYITHAHATKMLNTDGDKKILSNKMAHSVKTQSMYKKNVDEYIIKGTDEVENINKVSNKPLKYNKFTNPKEKHAARLEAKREWYEKNKEKVAMQRKLKKEKLKNNKIFI
jgi:integrase